MEKLRNFLPYILFMALILYIVLNRQVLEPVKVTNTAQYIAQNDSIKYYKEKADSLKIVTIDLMKKDSIHSENYTNLKIEHSKKLSEVKAMPTDQQITYFAKQIEADSIEIRLEIDTFALVPVEGIRIANIKFEKGIQDAESVDTLEVAVFEKNLIISAQTKTIQLNDSTIHTTENKNLALIQDNKIKDKQLHKSAIKQTLTVIAGVALELLTIAAFTF